MSWPVLAAVGGASTAPFTLQSPLPAGPCFPSSSCLFSKELWVKMRIVQKMNAQVYVMGYCLYLPGLHGEKRRASYGAVPSQSLHSACRSAFRADLPCLVGEDRQKPGHQEGRKAEP